MRANPPLVITRAEHPISRKAISSQALKVLYQLKDAGYEAAIVGGALRDLLTGLSPKDFDVVTDATPDEVKALFKNCRLIGRRFRLAHIYYGRHIVEVATFRKSHDQAVDAADAVMDNGMILRDNVYGTMDEDVWRRDFSINALYYRIEDFALLDYVGALEDIANKRIRTLGDPIKRFREDPVRMLRAIRFAAKLDFTLDPELLAAIHTMKNEIKRIPPARLFDESIKLFQSGYGLKTYLQLQETGLFTALFPQATRAFNKVETSTEASAGANIGADALLQYALVNTDMRIAESKGVNPAFIMAAILWESFQQRITAISGNSKSRFSSYSQVADKLLMQTIGTVAIHRRFCLAIKDIWLFQERFERRVGKRPQKFLTQQMFRAAYDFMLLRAKVGQVPQELADWWTKYQTLTPELQLEMSLPEPAKKQRRRKKPKAIGE